MTTITLTLTGIAHGGEAFGRHEGKIVFVPYAIPGEQVQVEIVEEKARWARARLLQVIEPSPDRVEPPCPYFGPGRCGGCQWQHIDYQRQVELKAEIVADQLRRLGRVERPPVLEPIALADEEGLLAFGYRNHVQLLADDQGRLGYVRDAQGRGSHDPEGRTGSSRDVIAVDECLLLHPLLDELHQALASQAADEDAADEAGERPATRLRRVSLRAGVNTGQRLLAFESQGDRAPAFSVEDLAVRCVLRRRDGSVQPLIGEPWIEEKVAGRVFRVSAGSFFQVNTVGAEAMVALADEMLSLQGHEVLLDGYCGVGLFALSLATRVAQVIGIEESEAACEDFAWNGAELDNVVLYEGPLAEVLAALGEHGAGESEPTLTTRIDVAIIDPPRSGAGPDAVRELRRLRVRRLLYVSCDPATLARDARHLLEAGYRLVQVQPVDLFPQTYHVESLALFQL